MRVGIFTNTYKPMVNENAIIVENLVKGLEGLGHKVFVVTLKNSNAEAEANVIRLANGVDNGEHGVTKNVKLSIEEKNKIKDLKLDMVHVFGVSSMANLGKRVANENNIPYVTSLLRDEEKALNKERSVLGKKSSKIKSKLLNMRINNILKNSSNVISYVPSTCKEYVDTIVNYGIDADIKLDDSLVKKIKPKGKNTYFIVNDGRIENDIAHIINKFKEIIKNDNKINLVILGGDKEVVEAYIDEEYKENIFFKEDRNLLYYYLTESEAMIYSSDIPSSYVYCTLAGIYGLPVIAEYNTYIEDVIKDYENGLFFHNVDELEDMIKILSKDKDLSKKVMDNKSKVIKDYSVAINAKNMEKMYLKAIRNKNSQRKDDQYKNRRIRRRHTLSK